MHGDETKDDAVDFKAGADEEWEEFFKKYQRTACPECVRGGKLHCSHNQRNRAAAAPSRTGAGAASAQRESIKTALWAGLEASHDETMMRLMRERAAAAPAGGSE